MPLNPLDLFIRATNALVNFSSQRDEELDVYILELQGAEVRTLWDKVKFQFEKCLDYLHEDKNSNEDDISAADIKYRIVPQIPKIHLSHPVEMIIPVTG